MTIEDFILLGWTAPHPTLRNGDCICAAGYSRKLNQFVRIYPVPFPFKADIHRWDQLSIPVIRNLKDNRPESWKVEYLDRDRDALSKLFKKNGRTVAGREQSWLQAHSDDSIAALNVKKQSLGFIRACNLQLSFRERPVDSRIITDSLFPEDNTQLEQSKFIPELEFHNIDGSRNRLKLLEWGCCEYLRKNPFDQEKLWGALRIGQLEYDHFLFVGNHNRHRTTWLVIALLWTKKSTQLSLF